MSNNRRDELRKAFAKIEVLEQGDFTSQGGAKVPYYVYVAKALGEAAHRFPMYRAIWELMKDKRPTHIVGMGTESVSLATIIADRNGLSLTFIEDRSGPLPGHIGGSIPNSGNRAALVDVGCTTGSKLRRMIYELESTGVTIVGVFVTARLAEYEPELPCPFSYSLERKDFRK